MRSILLCLLFVSSAYAGFDLGEILGNAVHKEVGEEVKKGLSGVFGDQIGGQLGDVSGELAGAVVKCYIDGLLNGTPCTGSALEALAGKAAGELLGDLGKDLKDFLDKEIDKLGDSIAKGIGGDFGKAVGGLVDDGLKGVVNDIAASDKLPECAGWKTYCTNIFYKEMMAEMCPKTCGKSGSSSSGTAATTTTTSAPAVTDKNTQCSSMKAYCNNAAYKTMMTEQCPKTCGITSTPTTSSSTSTGTAATSGYSKGVDVSDSVTADQFTCLKNEGFNLAIVRVYRNANGGSPDTNALTTMKNAKTAGLNVEIYHFPSPSKSGATQFDEMYNYVTGGGWTVKFVWLPVHNIDVGTGWSSDVTANRKVIQDFVDRATAKGVKVGIYSKSGNWDGVVGAWDVPTAVTQIWYWSFPATGLGTLTTEGFEQFGRRTSASTKRYAENQKICNINADLNVYSTSGTVAHVISDLAVTQK